MPKPLVHSGESADPASGLAAKYGTPFATFTYANFVSNVGGWMQIGAVPFVVFEMTGSAEWVGLAAFAMFFPSLLTTFVGGVLGDRHGKALVIAMSQGLISVASLVLLALWVLAPLSATYLLLLLGLQSLLRGFGNSSIQTLAPELVGSGQRSAAINLNSAQAQVAKVVGPALAGVVLTQFGTSWAFALNTLATSIACVLFFALRPQSKRSTGADLSLWANLVEGLGFVRKRFELRFIVVSTTLAIFLGGPLYQAISVLVSNRLQSDATAYGYLLGLYAIGSVAGNVLNSKVKVLPSRVVYCALSTWGVGVILAAWSTSLWITAVAVTIAGASYLLTTVTLMTRLQTLTPEYFRGRVVAIYTVASIAGVPVGAVVHGWASERVGLSVALTVAAAGLFALSLTLACANDLRRAIDTDPANNLVLDLTEEESLRALNPAA